MRRNQACSTAERLWHARTTAKAGRACRPARAGGRRDIVGRHRAPCQQRAPPSSSAPFAAPARPTACPVRAAAALPTPPCAVCPGLCVRAQRCGHLPSHACPCLSEPSHVVPGALCRRGFLARMPASAWRPSAALQRRIGHTHAATCGSARTPVSKSIDGEVAWSPLLRRRRGALLLCGGRVTRCSSCACTKQRVHARTRTQVGSSAHLSGRGSFSRCLGARGASAPSVSRPRAVCVTPPPGARAGALLLSPARGTRRHAGAAPHLCVWAQQTGWQGPCTLRCVCGALLCAPCGGGLEPPRSRSRRCARPSARPGHTRAEGPPVPGGRTCHRHATQSTAQL